MGPALFLILFFGVFLAVDLIGLGFNYCSCLTLNDLQLREAAKVPMAVAQDPKGPIRLGVPNSWRSTVMGGLSGVREHPETCVSYSKKNGMAYVTVATCVQVHPPLTIPLFPGVPGLGAPVLFTITNSRLME